MVCKQVLFYEIRITSEGLASLSRKRNFHYKRLAFENVHGSAFSSLVYFYKIMSGFHAD